MVEVKIIWSEESLNNIEEIISFISRGSEFFAMNFASKIMEAVDTLKVFSEIGRVVPEYDNMKIREILYRNYRIVYKIDGKVVEILTIFHGSKLLEKRIMKN